MRALALVCLAVTAAHADDKASAEALFEDAKALVAKGDYAGACGKFEASYKFDRALGTKLNLADCHEHLGKIATAWAEYIEVEEATKDLTDDKSKERAAFARDRVAALAPKLIRLRLDPPPGAIAGLVVKRDGEDVTAILGTAVPIDPGSHVIEASAPGFVAWSQSVALGGEGTTTPLQIPALVAAPTPPPPPGATPIAPNRVGIGGELAGGLLFVPDLIFPADRCQAPSQSGGSLAPAVFADIRLQPWLRLRAGLRFQLLVRGYATNDRMGNTLCQADGGAPKNITTFILGPLVELEPRLAGGPSWDVHARGGTTLAFPLGNGEIDIPSGSGAPVPGVTAGSPVQLSFDVGVGVRTHGVSFDLLGRAFATTATDKLDMGNDKLILLAIGYSSL